jgi:hypothetical protein
MRVTVSMDGRWHGAYLLPSFETARAEEARASSGRGCKSAALDLDYFQ